MSILQYNRKTFLADAKIGRGNLITNTGGCSCAESAYVSNILKNIGMPYAAGMHAKKNGDWSSNDLYLHAKEEDEKLFPLLRKVATYLEDKEKVYLLSEVDELEREHYDFVYPAVEKNIDPPEVPFQRHGSKEDLLIRKYAHQLLILGHALDKCDVCKNYAWDMAIQKPIFNNGTFHHPGCTYARVKVAKVGASYDLSAIGKSTAKTYAENNEDYKAGKEKYEQGKQKYDEYKGKYEQGKQWYEALTADPIAEEYSGAFWSSGMISDPSIAELKKALDSAAKAGEETRKARENDTRARGAAVAGIAGLAGGPLVAAAIYAFVEGGVWLSKLWGNKSDSQAERDRAVANVKELWDKWRIVPPAYSGDVMSAKLYADVVRNAITWMDATENDGPKWRDEWVKVNDNAIKLVSEKKFAILRDAAALGLFPVQYEKWAMLGFYGDRNHGPDPMLAFPTPTDKFDAESRRKGYLNWGASVTYTTTHKKFLSAGKSETSATYTAPTWGRMKHVTDPIAAGIGVMIAAYTGKSWEACIEESIIQNGRYSEAVGPSPHVQNWRLKGVFLEVLNRSQNMKSRSYKKNLEDVIDKHNPLDLKTTAASTIVGAATGAGLVYFGVAGLTVAGPIGLAVGLATAFAVSQPPKLIRILPVSLNIEAKK
jgi:hypothetical protein